MNQELHNKILEMLENGHINVAGNIVLGDQNIENHVDNVEQGGVGIVMPGGTVNMTLAASATTPMTKNDQNIKAVIEELLTARDENDVPLFKNKKQWWAVYRVLKEHCNYPSQMNSFITKMNELGFSEIDEGRRPSYESIKKVSGDVPQMATTTTTTWNTVKEKSENYAQQYVVAEFLMKKLAI